MDPSSPHATRPGRDTLACQADTPVPCFFWHSCRRTAALEKQGKSVCRECAARLKGRAYPARAPARAPLYDNDAQLMRDLDM